MGKLGSLALVKQPVEEEKENSEFKLRLKIDVVSHPARGTGIV